MERSEPHMNTDTFTVLLTVVVFVCRFPAFSSLFYVLYRPVDTQLYTNLTVDECIGTIRNDPYFPLRLYFY